MARDKQVIDGIKTIKSSTQPNKINMEDVPNWKFSEALDGYEFKNFKIGRSSRFNDLGELELFMTIFDTANIDQEDETVDSITMPIADLIKLAADITGKTLEVMNDSTEDKNNAETIK